VSRREIRQMLMGPKRKRGLLDHPWGMPGLMVAVLAVGVGFGAGIGVIANRGQEPASSTQQAPAPVIDDARNRAPRRDAMIPRDEDGPLMAPPVIVPPPRTGDTSHPEPASLIVPPPPAGTKGEPPAWIRYAVPPPRTGGRPMVAVVIDDLGLDKRRTERVTTLRAPLTLAFMTYAEDLDHQTSLAHSRGHELLVHVPMQPMNGSYDAGPEVLDVGLPADELRRRIDWGLSRFKGFVGINNHMGSRFTADVTGMKVVMQELNRRGLMFLDSVTSEHSVAADAARSQAVPFAAREVFLDNTQTVASVRSQLDRVEQLARKHGYAIAIGHPHDATVEALSSWLPALETKGFILVPVTAIVKASNGQNGLTAVRAGANLQ
jgi:uncharacterized protein